MSKAKEIQQPKASNSDVINNLVESILNGNKGFHFNVPKAKVSPVVISSGSLLMDSCVTIKTGSTIRMGGPAEVGKTSQSFLFIKNYMDTMPKSKAIYVNAEFKLSEEIQKRTGLKFVFNIEEWQHGTVFVLQTNVFDTICQVLHGVLKKCYEFDENVGIVLDSLDMLILQSTLEKEMGAGKKPAGINFMTKELFRWISPYVSATNALLFIITQYSATFNLDPYSKEPPQIMEGNNTHALNHQCSNAFYYKPRGRKDYILEDDDKPPHQVSNKILGVKAKVEVRKSATDNSGYTIEIPIKKGKIGNCVWTEKEVTDLVLAFELAKKDKAWITFNKDIIEEAAKDKIDVKEKINGLAQLYAYFEEEAAVCQWFLKKVKSINQIRMGL